MTNTLFEPSFTLARMVNCRRLPDSLQARNQLLRQALFRFRPQQASTGAAIFFHVGRELDELCHIVSNLGASRLIHPILRLQKIRIQPEVDLDVSILPERSLVE